MTSSTLHLVETKRGNAYESVVWRDSAVMPGVRYGVARISFGRRIELARRVHEIARKAEFLEAGSDAREKLEAVVIHAEADRAYLETCLTAIEGLTIDGEIATPENLIERGPIDLAAEILAAVKTECSLSGDERKN